MIVAGIDIGSRTAKAVVMNSNSVLSSVICDTGPDSVKTSHTTMAEALKGTGLSQGDIQYIVATGYGRVLVPFANENVSEISCHARGINWYFPSVRTILDMGGQDCKAINCDSNGLVTNFIMNVAAIAISLPVALVIAPYLGVAGEVILFSSLVVAG